MLDADLLRKDQQYTVTTKFVDTVELSNKDVYRCIFTSFDRGMKFYERYEYVHQDKNGIQVIGELDDTMTEPELFRLPRYSIKTPIKVGTTWERKFEETYLLNEKFDINLRYTILSLSETHEVPAGTFENCMKIRAIGVLRKKTPSGKSIVINKEGVECYAPNLGVIHVEFKEKSTDSYYGSGAMKVQLLSYE